MNMTTLDQIAIVPALLVTLGALLMLRSGGEETARRRFVLYLLVIGTLLALAPFLAIRLVTLPYGRPLIEAWTLLLPALIGVLALLLLHWKEIAGMSRGVKLLAVGLALVLVVILVSEQAMRFGWAYTLVPVVLVLALSWTVGHRFPKAGLLLAVFLLSALFLLNLFFNNPPGEPAQFPRWLGFVFFGVVSAVPGLAMGLAAALLGQGLQARDGRMRLLLALVAVVLVGYLAYSAFWASLWDQTSDGLLGGALSQPPALVAAGAGIVMAVTLTGWRRAAGFAFAIVVPLLLYRAFELGWDVNYHVLTEERADRIAAALAEYRAQEGAYPAALDELAPRHLLWVPRPVELQGETWCYQGGDDFFRLGAFSREFFSAPVELAVYAADGEPEKEWACAGQLAAMKERYYSPMEDPAAMQPPLPTPLPVSDIAQEASSLAPLLGAEGATLWGSWSPAGAYFLLGLRGQDNVVTLTFLNGQTGELCAVPGNYYFPPMTVSLRERHAWLADGQLLLVDDTEEVVLLTPCTPEVKLLTPEAGAGLTEMMARAANRVLFKSEDAYWIFDGARLTWQLVVDVTPNPYELHWDQATWQPDGKLLAISRLNGRDANEGSTLTIVDGSSAKVQRTIPLAAGTDQSAARVDWLTPQKLLLISGGVPRILDLSSDPPQETEVLAELFGLDLDFPNEVGGHDWRVDWEKGSYMLTIQANHERNQAHYIYHSVTDSVEMYDVEHNLLLLFPDRLLVQWPVPESEQAYEDEFVLVEVASGEVWPPLTIAGHTPRNYPQLNMSYVEATGELVVASSQGISLHSLPEGEMTDFWTLEGQGFAPYVRVAPGGSALVAIRDQGGVYWLPLLP